MDHSSVYQMFQAVSTANEDRLAYRSKQAGTWTDMTWSQARHEVERISRSLIALGVESGERVCILSQTRLEWVLCDLGISCSGAVTVGIYPSNLAADCGYIIRHSDAEVVFVEDSDQLDKVLEVRTELPALRHLVVFDGPSDPDRQVLGWHDFLARGEEIPAEEARRRGEEIRAEDLASIVYTSGTTGVPKGAMITHRNLVFTSGSVVESLHIEPHYRTLLFLPLAHVFARLIVYACLRYGAPLAFAQDIPSVPQNLAEIRPEFIASVPRIYEKAYDRILSSAEAAGGLKLKLFHWALGVGRQASELQQRKQPLPAGLRLRHRLARGLVLHKVADAFGGRMAWAISGAAPLNKTIAEFFHACGVLILEGIGMTENTSFSHVNRFDNNKFGTVGVPGPGIEHRIAEDGEVLIRGTNVMKGYFKDPAATAETIDQEGWLHTGDIGQIDDDGFLRITDRKKDLLITAGGKNVAPQRIEQILRTSHFIAQAVACGDRRRFITALITLDPDAIRQWAAEHDLAGASLTDLAAHPEARRLIDSEVQEKNRQLASFESVKRFHILPRDFTIEAGELTPTLKLKRKVILEKHAEVIEELYRE